MSHTVNHDSTNWALLQGLPFAGLGFDLQAVAQHAARMLLMPCLVDSGREWCQAVEAPVAGYLLQLWLGRETRAG